MPFLPALPSLLPGLAAVVAAALVAAAVGSSGSGLGSTSSSAPDSLSAGHGPGATGSSSRDTTTTSLAEALQRWTVPVTDTAVVGPAITDTDEALRLLRHGLEGPKAHMSAKLFDADASGQFKLEGSDGCNLFTAEATAGPSDGVISVGMVMSTKRGCTVDVSYKAFRATVLNGAFVVHRGTSDDRVVIVAVGGDRGLPMTVQR